MPGPAFFNFLLNICSFLTLQRPFVTKVMQFICLARLNSLQLRLTVGFTTLPHIQTIQPLPTHLAMYKRRKFTSPSCQAACVNTYRFLFQLN